MAKKSKHSANPLDKRRPVESREMYKRFLIVCEGEKTEPNYFLRYRELLRRLCEVEVVGTGYNTVSLVNEAMRLAGERKLDPDKDDEIWCVFDRDSFTKQEFNGAIELASNNKLFVAYSNQAFELWYLLHFNYEDTAYSRQTYQKRLSKLLGKKYEKNSTMMFFDLLEKQEDAIRNAYRLHDSHTAHLPPADKDPSTTVHLLVESLNRNRKPR